jgi:hypothetical protein
MTPKRDTYLPLVKTCPVVGVVAALLQEEAVLVVPMSSQ